MNHPLFSFILMVGLIACAGPPGDDEGPAFDQIRIPIGSAPAAVLVLDVNHDQLPDLVVANQGDGTITVLQGDGRGNFQPRSTVAVGESPNYLAAGDFDEDGWSDLIVSNHETDYVTVLFGGESGFEQREDARIVVGVSPHPHAVEAADIDEDGHLDFFVDERGAEAFKLYFGQGDGSFVQRGSIPVGGGGPLYGSIAVSDLDGDGHLDVVTPTSRSVAILMGDGTGEFSSPAQLDAVGLPPRPFSVAVADVNGDGFLDVGAGSGEGDGAFVVWLGSSSGEYRLDPNSPYRLARGVTSAGAADVNGDGFGDFLVTSYNGNALTILLGGTEHLRPVRLEVEGNPWRVSTGDFNGDGLTDLVTANSGTDDVSVFLQRTN